MANYKNLVDKWTEETKITERQNFIDEVAKGLFMTAAFRESSTGFNASKSYELAEKLWEERERRLNIESDTSNR